MSSGDYRDEMTDTARALSVALHEAEQKIHTLERELVLARAHDSQPYPTADAYEKVCATLNASKTRNEFLERTLREHLWLNHGHEGLYGDDGEMQCAACIPYSVSDYKRQPVEELLAGLRNLALHRLAVAKPT